MTLCGRHFLREVTATIHLVRSPPLSKGPEHGAETRLGPQKFGDSSESIEIDTIVEHESRIS